MFQRVLASLHEAAMDDDAWPAASALIDEACGATGNSIVAGDGAGSKARILFATYFQRGQRREDLERDYFQNYFPHDERIPRLMQLPFSRMIHVPDLYTAGELKRSATFNEALTRYGTRRGLDVRLQIPQGTRVTWAIADPVKQGSWSSPQLDMIERLLPHIRQFVSFRQALASAEALGASLTGLLDNSRFGVIHLDRRGKILAVNTRARAIFLQGDGLLDEGGFLGALRPVDEERLMRLVAGALPASDRAPSGGSMMIRRAPALPGLTLHINPVTASQMDLGGSSVGALVLVADPESKPRIDAGTVAAALNLTPAQGRVAELLARGWSLVDIAVATGRSDNTIRSHRLQIHRKLGISRRAELVQLVRSVMELPPSRG